MEGSARRFRAALGLLFLVALGLRLAGIRYDADRHFHPDERRIAEAVLEISFQPLRLNPKFFAYGSFPFYVTRLASGAAGLVDPWFRGYDGVLRTGRVLGCVWGAAAVVLTGLLGRRLFGARAGLLGAGFLAIAVLHLQNSRFLANDVPLGTLVLLALLLLVRHVQDGRSRDLLLGGAVLGLALATKVSAAPAFAALVVAAALRGAADRRTGRTLALLAGAFGLAFAAFWLGEPYALLDPQAFWHDVAEQSRMVREAGIVPYTNQYVGTPHGLYELKEIVLWGMGPALGLAALAGTAWRLRRPGRLLSSAEVVVVAYAVPLFLLNAAFQVRFPRYLLPVHPLLALAAAAFLLRAMEKAGRAGRVLAGAVVALSVAWTAAFLTISFRPFTVLAASEWFHGNVGDGARVVIQDWDEGFPFHLPDRSPERYRVTTFPFYAEDGAAKGRKLAATLADADWLVLQTKRILGATTQNPARFPMTVRFFQSLYAGDLGFVLEKEFVSRPALLGISFPDELADESFSVYDHPKVVLFRNAARLSKEQLEARFAHGLPSRRLTRTEMLLAGPGDAPRGVPALPPVGSSLAAILLAVLALEGLALAGSTFLLPRLPAPFGTPALGRVLGVLVFAFAPWLAVSLGLVPLGRPVLLGWLLAIVAWGIVASRRRSRERAAPGDLASSALAFWVPFGVFLAFRLLNPEVVWGEKPMDFAFLNALYRAEALPPPEPWAAGTPLSYTYFGHFVVAALGRALGIAPALAFNLGIATFAGLAGAGLYAAGAFAGRSRAAGVWALFIGLFAGNLSGLRELLSRRVVNFDTFWATSRVVKEGINEYPFWSFLFADLHAHVLAVPFSLATVALLVLWISRREVSPHRELSRPALLAALALSLGATFVTNGWSLPTYAGLTAAAFGVDALVRARGWRRLGSAAGALVVSGLVLGGAFGLYAPFWRSFAPPPRHVALEVGPFARPGPFLEVFGLFLVLLVPFLLVAYAAALREDREALPPPRRLLVALLALVLVAALFAVGPVAFGSATVPSIRAFAAALAAAGLFLALRGTLPERLRAPALLAGWGFALVAGAETLFVWDRMNTVFKFWYDAALVFAVAGGAVAAGLTAGRLARGAGRSLWTGAAAGALALALLTTAVAAGGALRPRRAPEGPRGTLDGTAYLARRAPADAAAFRWLNENVDGVPTIAEASGDSYVDFARVSMNTGLPTILGWGYHVFQRGVPQADVDRRRREVAAIYRSTDPAVVGAALRRTGAALVYEGRLEREKYGAGLHARFLGFSDLLTPLRSFGDATIWSVNEAFDARFPERRVGGREIRAAIAPPAGEAPVEETAPSDEPLGRLAQPRGVAVGPAGETYVVDFGNARVQVYEKTTAVRAFGVPGSEPGELRDPCGVAVGPAGDVYVTDFNGRVQVFAPDGTFRRVAGAELFGPRGVAVEKDGTVWVSDTGNARLVRFAPDGARQVVGKPGRGEAEFDDPMGIAVAPDGTIWVADNGNGRLQAFDRKGRFVRAIAVPGWRREVFSEPTVSVSASGRIALTVPLESEVRVLGPTGAVEKAYSGRTGIVPLAKPMGVAWAKDGALVVSDLEGRLVWLR